MKPAEHRRIAERIRASMDLLGPADSEMRIEGAMLAGTHWANYALHRHGVAALDEDVVHNSMLVVNTLRKYSLVEPEVMESLSRIEELRPLYVRGDVPNAAAAADEAVALLDIIAARALAAATEGDPSCRD